MSVFDEMGFKLEEVNLDEELVYNIAVTHLLVSKVFSQFYREFNMSLARFNALVMVDRLGGEKGLTQKETSQKLIVSGANIVGLIDRLEKDALVTRVPDPDDRRMNRIRVTDKGKRLVTEVWPIHLSRVASLLQEISPTDREATISCLTGLRKTARKALSMETNSPLESA